MKRAQQGFALVAAIVMVVVLAALAGFVASLVGGQGATQQLERMSQVVARAAQTGVEWGAYRVLRPATAPACPPATNLALPGSLGVTTVRVTCTRVNVTENGSPVSVYRITATASFGVLNSPDYVERVKTAVFSR
jgi:MSHA biogenesis protein MshP